MGNKRRICITVETSTSRIVRRRSVKVLTHSAGCDGPIGFSPQGEPEVTTDETLELTEARNAHQVGHPGGQLPARAHSNDLCIAEEPE